MRSSKVTVHAKSGGKLSKNMKATHMRIEPADDGGFMTETRHQSPEAMDDFNQPMQMVKKVHPNIKHLMDHVKATFSDQPAVTKIAPAGTTDSPGA